MNHLHAANQVVELVQAGGQLTGEHGINSNIVRRNLLSCSFFCLVFVFVWSSTVLSNIFIRLFT